jgi:hypothetical protein
VKTIISRMLTLQDLELQSPEKRGSEAKNLREQIPAEMLQRFDRFLVRGKKGVALVQNSICKGCQIAVPVGVVNGLIQGLVAPVCGNCGRYLYLADADVAAFQAGMRFDTIIVSKTKAPTLTTVAINTKAVSPGRKKAKTPRAKAVLAEKV